MAWAASTTRERCRATQREHGDGIAPSWRLVELPTMYCNLHVSGLVTAS